LPEPSAVCIALQMFDAIILTIVTLEIAAGMATLVAFILTSLWW
jgi:hypothetical protein